jgi:hypothetical protein
MIALRLILAVDCPKVAANKITDLCGVIYPGQSDGLSACRPFSPGRDGLGRGLINAQPQPY